MSEEPIAISNLNDFIFCPVSIYFHSLEDGDDILTKDSYQLNGSNAHVLQGIGIYCEKYNLVGKIDVFDTKSGILTERKKKITKIYDGYVFQIYAQYFSLIEMGYKVVKLHLYSMDDNKVYDIPLPEIDANMFEKFEKLILELNGFSFENFKQSNELKCKKCIYEPLCSYSCLKEDE